MPRAKSFPILHRYALHIRLLWAAAPGWSLLCLALTVIASAATALSLVTTGQLVGALTEAVRTDPDAGDSDPATAAIWWTAATSALFLIVPVASSVRSFASKVVSGRYLVLLCDSMAEASTHPYGIRHLEDPDWTTRHEAVGRAPKDWLFLHGVGAGWTLLGIRLSGLGAFIILASWIWWSPIVLAVGWLVFSRAFSKWTNKRFDQLLDVTGNDRRRASYLHSLLTGGRSAKEVRLFGLGQFLADRHVTAWQTAMRAVWENRASSVRSTIVTLSAPLITLTLVLGFLLYDRTGALDTGFLVTLVQAVFAMEAFGPQTDPQSALAQTASVLAGLEKLRAEEGLPPVPEPATRGSSLTTTSSDPASSVSASSWPASTVGPSRGEPVPAAIEFLDVSFTYPSSDRPALDGLNLTIPAGQSVALVGLNGAGKSTLIKLLCGLYPPDRGFVGVDGAEPGADDAVRRRIAVIFQDFVRYHLSLRDNIAPSTGDQESLDHESGDHALLDRALRDAGGTDLFSKLGDGWDTVLSAEYDGGTDLSGGQWQRVALARALAALGRGAGVLVLDEPTAALDIRVEAALFDRFLSVARGATTILVSHRLSSVRHAERIVVLADTGRGAHIVEDGDHDSLMAADGRYAELFTLQASRFATAGEGR